MCILFTPRPIYQSTSQSTNRPTLDQCIGRHIGWVSTDMSVDIWSSVGRYVDRDMSVDVSTDVPTEISAEWWLTDRPTISRSLGLYSSRHSADTLTIDCRQNVGWPSVVYRSKAYIVSVRCMLYTFHPFLVNLKNFWRLHVRPSCATNSVVIRQDTQVKYCQIRKIQLTGKRIRTNDNKVLV